MPHNQLFPSMTYPHNHNQLEDSEDPTSHPLRADALTGPYYGLPPPEIFHLGHSADTNTEQLVEEERQLYLGALGVRALLNARAPINCLPVELLIEIFQAAQQVNGLEWLRMLEVCRHWFAVGASTSTLWTRITVESRINHLKTSLARSKSSLVEVAVTGNTVVSKALVSLFPHLHRVSCLSLPNLGDRDMIWILKFLRSSMPALWRLDANVWPTNEYYIRAMGPPAELLIDSALAPNLRELSIGFMHISPASPGLAHLRSLQLHNVSDVLKIADIAKLLRPCLNLHELSIHDVAATDERESDASNAIHPVVLPQLSVVSMSGTAEFLKHILKFFEIPATARAHLTRTLPSIATGMDYRTGLCVILPVSRSTLPILACATHADITILQRDHTIVCSAGPPDTCTGSLTLSLQSPLRLDDPLEVLHNAPLRELSLHLEPSEAHFTDWRAVFSTFPELHTLTLSTFSGSVLVDADRVMYTLDPQGAPIRDYVRRLFQALSPVVVKQPVTIRRSDRADSNPPSHARSQHVALFREAGQPQSSNADFEEGAVPCPKLRRLRIRGFRENEAGLVNEMAQCLEKRQRALGLPLALDELELGPEASSDQSTYNCVAMAIKFHVKERVGKLVY
ncbi:hypothetical protein C8Q74DRAFT_309557 [Fomes fomentarius]|nr:hypothetical protein C8Q74DRAFT_309557 [Fomes fomentarius]